MLILNGTGILQNIANQHVYSATTQTLPGGATTNTTLQSYGVPTDAIDVIISQSTNAAGKTLKSTGVTVNSVTFADLATLDSFDISSTSANDFATKFYGYTDAQRAKIMDVFVASSNVTLFNMSGTIAKFMTGWNADLPIYTVIGNAVAKMPILDEIDFSNNNIGGAFAQEAGISKLYASKTVTTIDYSGNGDVPDWAKAGFDQRVANALPNFGKTPVAPPSPDKPVKPGPSLKSTGVPQIILEYMVANSMTADGKTLAAKGYTADTITMADMKKVDILNISDINNSNGIAKLIGSMSQNDVQSGAWASTVKMIEANPDLRVLNLSGILQLRTSYPTGADMLGQIETAKYMPKLQSVNISNNNLGDGALTNYLLGQNFFSASINTLDLSSNNIANMSGSSMAKLTGLRNWVISNNKLTMLPDGLNDPNSPLSKQLQSLVLDNNKFATLPAWITTAAKNGLIILTATGNTLVSADPALLQKPSSLEYLNLLNQGNTTGPSTGSFYIDNSGTTAIKTYNSIMNDPDLQVWLANDTDGALAAEIKTLKGKIDARSDYQAVLNDYTVLLEKAELSANQAAVTVTLPNKVAVVVKVSPYDPAMTEDAMTEQALKQVKAMPADQLSAYGLKPASVANLGPTDVRVNMDNILTPLTVGDVNAFLDKYKDSAKYAAVAQLPGNQSTLATYDQLPPAPQPNDYAKPGVPVPDYYSTEISVLTTQREQIVTTIVITTGKMDILADALEAAGDKAGADKIRAQAKNLLDDLQNLPAANDTGSISDFFYMRSIVLENIDVASDAVKKAIDGTEDTLTAAIDSGKLTPEQIKEVSSWKDSNADAVAQGLVNSGKADSVDDVKKTAEEVAEELSKDPTYTVIDKDGHDDPNKTITDTVTDSQTAAGNPPADTKPSTPDTPTTPVEPEPTGGIDVMAPDAWEFCLDKLSLGPLDVDLDSGDLGFSVQDTRSKSTPYTLSVSMSDFRNVDDNTTIPNVQLQLLQPSLVAPVAGTQLSNGTNQINIEPNVGTNLLANDGSSGKHKDEVKFSGARIYAPSTTDVRVGEYTGTLTWNVANTPGADIQ